MARKDAEKYVLSVMDSIDPSKTNSNLYKKRFEGMTDKEFDGFMQELQDGNNSLMVNASGKAELSHERNLKTLSKMGVSIFKKVIITRDGKKHKPNIDYVVITLPYRRAAQHIKKNFSVHRDLKTRNSNTGQVTGNSKAGSFTYPEAQLMSALNLKNTARELLGTRGGDLAASNAYASLLYKNGKVTAKEMEIYRGKTGGALYVKALFKAKHMDLNL